MLKTYSKVFFSQKMRGQILAIFFIICGVRTLDLKTEVSFLPYRFAKLKTKVPGVQNKKRIDGYMRDKNTFISCKFAVQLCLSIDYQLTPQVELGKITPQVEPAKKWSICEISIENCEKIKNVNSRI
jgi:hypothetical protein